ncbi:hypothetical protein GCM10023322_31350 [Rugosimonospora acidiphila]|uniref:Uncharacterized protein n=1 Tax=Rugosimonospora acidiphila TaxID=556531 RepID=A0ABP9RU15_9ACTN
MDETTGTSDHPTKGVTRRNLIVGTAAAAGAAGAMTLLGQPTAAFAGKTPPPSGPAGVDDEYLMTLTNDPTDVLSGIDYDYLTYPGVDVFMYNNGYNGTFGDEHLSGITVTLHGQRVAGNGDIHLLPVPEQWDAAAPASSSPITTAARQYDRTNNVITLPMKYVYATGPTVTTELSMKYNLKATPEPGGFRLEVTLQDDLPKQLAGSAAFNLEFIPSLYKSKSYQVDSTGNGTYDTYGVFPLAPEDPMDEDWPRPTLVGNAWYVDQWNTEKGDAQPRALARGYKFSLAPEDDLVRITVESDELLSIYDGRNRSQNGWFTMSSKIPLGAKAGQTVATWHIKAPVQPNWVRKPNLAHSQVGYGTGLSKVAVMEIDKNDTGAPSSATLVQLNADGSYTAVFTADLGAARPWARYNYCDFDFSSVKTPGIYAIEYAGLRSEVFPIGDDVYDRAWQPALSGFLTVAMDHIELREGYRIWHGAQHMDDARLGEPFANSPTTGNSISWFDGQSVALEPAIPQVVKDKGLEPGDRIPGLNQGGWCDAGDFDLQLGSNLTVLQNLIYTAQTFNNLDGYDTVSVTWDPETGGTAEMHRPDGVPDIVHQVKHGALQIRAQIENVGIVSGTIEVPSLRQYTHLGDGSTDTDGYIYDPSLDENEIVERDGKVYSGKNDDRMLMTGGRPGTALLGGPSIGMAGAAAVLKGYDDAFAADCLTTAETIWANEGQAAINSTNGGSRGNAFNTLVQLILATEAHGKTADYATYTAKLVELLAKAPAGTTNPFSTFLPITTYYSAALVLDQMDKVQPGYRDQVTSATVAAAGIYAYDTTTPFGFSESLTATWGPGSGKFQTAFNATMLLKNLGTSTAGLEPLKDVVLRGVNYTVGNHPYNDTSWVTGVGVKSHQLPYNSNRADGGKILGSIVPGYLNFKPNFPESLDNFAFLWAENESTVSTVSTWIAPARMAADLAHEAAAKVGPAASKDFSGKYSMKVQETSNGTGMPYETLATPGFELFMYNTTFSGVFGDQHCAGVELVLHGERVATNGDIHLLPTPEQWDATPAPILKGRSSDKGSKTVSASLTLPGTKDGKKPAVNYTLKATPEPGGVKLTVVLDKPLPPDLEGVAGFNLEFVPDRYRTKSYQTDTNGDGTYDDFGYLPLLPFDEMELKERARTEDQAWYVKEWNKDRGDYQPVPLTTGKTITLAPEDPENRIRITSDSGDLQLLDGRNRAQNGWFVVRTLFKSGSTELVWHIKADVAKDWTRQPNIGHSQAGYAPNQSKVAVLELDVNHKGPDTATLEQVHPDGTFTNVFTGKLGKAKRWLRYDYRSFDFSKVTAPGLYRVNYDGVRTKVFVIAADAYDKVWQKTLVGYLAKQMDHIAVREAYKITHAASHMDDAIMWPLLGEPFRDEAAYDGTWFDGQNFAPTSRTNTKYQSLEHIPGLAVGGWYDAGDFDLEATRHAEVIEDLVIAWREFKPAYDTLDVTWDATTGGMVELHRPDGTPDLLQQIKHGVLNVLARIEAIGYNFKVVEVPTLRQYTHLGDGARDTDGYIYDPSLGENERNGLRAGKQDDRLAMVGLKDTNLQYTAACALAAAASVLKEIDSALATRCLDAAKDIWATEKAILSLDGISPTDTRAISAAQRQMAVEWNAAIELLIATGDSKYKDAINALWPLMRVANGQTLSFGGGGWKAALVLDQMDRAFKDSFKSAMRDYKVAYDESVADNPYGVPPTVGMWGGTTGVLDMGIKMYFLHKVDPQSISSDYTLRSATYILGTHPHNDTSWVSGVGTSSVEHGYGNTRADDTFVAGGVVPGYVQIMPDLPEAKDQFGMLWFESEYVIDTAAKWIFVGNAINALVREPAGPPTGPAAPPTGPTGPAVPPTGPGPR